jgi:hypothetical protein
MKITIESTTKIVVLKPDNLSDGVPARVWEGQTESGIKVNCFITRIAIDKNETRAEEFERELKEQRVPTPEIESYPSRLIL